MLSLRNAIIAAALGTVLLGGCTFKASSLPGANNSTGGDNQQVIETPVNKARGVSSNPKSAPPAPPLIIYRGGEG